MARKDAGFTHFKAFDVQLENLAMLCVFTLGVVSNYIDSYISECVGRILDMPTPLDFVAVYQFNGNKNNGKD